MPLQGDIGYKDVLGVVANTIRASKDLHLERPSSGQTKDYNLPLLKIRNFYEYTSLLEMKVTIMMERAMEHSI